MWNDKIDELLQTWFNEKRTSVSVNEIQEKGLIGKLALVILKEQYEAHYIESDDAHFCGTYSFKNPLGHEEERFMLYYMIPHSKEVKMIRHMGSNNIDDLIKEIIRLEYGDIYWHHKELIPNYIKKIKNSMFKNMYIKSRYWFINTEKIWTV